MTETNRNRTSAPWWRAFFDDAYAAYGLLRSDLPPIDETIDYLVDALDLQPGAMVFDQCCGVGRLSIPLGLRGMHVVGVDFVESYVAAARRRAASDGIKAEFHHDDAHAFVAPCPCDAAVNWFTSFGYDEDDDRNRQIMQRAFDSLRPGGRYALDYMNTPRVLSDFRPQIIDRPQGEGLDGLIVLHESEADFQRGMIDSDWTFLYPDGRRIQKHVSTRLYLPRQLAGLLETCGFVIETMQGKVDGQALDRSSPRCIIIARRPT